MNDREVTSTEMLVFLAVVFFMLLLVSKVIPYYGAKKEVVGYKFKNAHWAFVIPSNTVQK